MVKDLTLQEQVDRLEESKYDTRWEAVKGFASGALPAVITGGAIGLGTALFGVAVVGLGGLLGIGGGIAAAAIPSALAVGGLLGAGGAATITGGARAMRVVHDARERNHTMDTMAQTLAEFAEQKGESVEIRTPEERKEKEVPAFARESSAANASAQGRPKFIEDILEKGRNTLDPKSLIEKAKEDVQQAWDR